MTRHKCSVHAVAFSKDGKRIVSGSSDNTLRLWDAEQCALAPIGQPMTGHNHRVQAVAFSNDGRRIVSGSHDRTLRLWNAQQGSPIGLPMIGHSNSVTAVAFSSDKRHIVSGSSDKTIKIWNTQTQASLQTINGINSVIYSLAISFEENCQVHYIAIGCRDNSI